METISQEPPRESADDLRARAEQHAREAERLLETRWLSSHIKGQLHATLALYYATGHNEHDR